MGPSLPRRRVLAVAALVSILRTSLAGAARFGRDAATLALRSQSVEYALDGRPAPLVHWQRSPYDLYRHSRFRERAGEPFTPRIPRLIANHPTMSGAVLAAVGMVGNWLIVSQMAGWPDWTLFPSMLLATLSLLAMCLGMVLVVVRWLEPIVARMDFNWDADPVGSLGLPPTLDRKLETLGYWSADDICRAVESGRFQWTALELTERRLIEQAVAFHKARASSNRRSDAGKRRA